MDELGLPEFTMTQRLLRRGLSMDEAACAQKIPADKLRQFYSSGLQKYNPGEVAAECKRQESEGRDFCRIRPEDSGGHKASPKFRFLDLDWIWPLLKLGMSPAEISERLHLDHKEFAAWYAANKHLLDKFLKEKKQ